jgi:hypothetical protein
MPLPNPIPAQLGANDHLTENNSTDNFKQLTLSRQDQKLPVTKGLEEEGQKAYPRTKSL